MTGENPDGVTALRGKVWNCGIIHTEDLRSTIPVSVTQLKSHISNRRTMGAKIPAADALSWVLDMMFSNDAGRKSADKHTKLLVITQNNKAATAK